SGEHISVQSPAIYLPSLLQTSANATLIVRTQPSRGRQYFLGTLDSQGHLETWKHLELIESQSNNVLGPGNVDWSPDGRQIVYVASAGRVVRIRNLTTGEDHELYRSNGEILNCVWAHQHPNLYCGLLLPDKTEILSVMLDYSGHAQSVGTLDGMRLLAR